MPEASVPTLGDVLAELRALRRLVELQATAPAAHARVLAALPAVFGSEPFTAAELGEALAIRVQTRAALRDAVAAALAGRAPSPERLGKLLRGIADAGATEDGWALSSPASERGVRLWALRRVGG